MAEKVTLKQVYFNDVETKFGPAVKVVIVTKEYPGVRMSSFTKGLDAWKEGDEVMVDITKNGAYSNFKPAGMSGGESTSIEPRVKKLEDSVFGARTEPVAQEDFDNF